VKAISRLTRVIAFWHDGAHGRRARLALQKVGAGRIDGASRGRRDRCALSGAREGAVRRVFLAGGGAGIALMIALVMAGGLSFKREVDYVECERFAVPSATVRIQSSPVGPAWGHPRFLELSSYGPPYDLLILGTLDGPDAARAPGAPGSSATGAAPDSLEITDLTVEADGAAVLSLPRVVVPVESLEVRAGGGKRSAKGFVFTARAFTSATPARLRVAGTLAAPARGRDQVVRFAHVFEARRSRRLALGHWTWNF
jgi:hypothetical protein